MDQAQQTSNFDPARYLTKVGSSDYLEVKWRLVWLREVHPDANIETEEIKVIPPSVDPEGVLVGWAMFKATITIPTGGSATGYGTESIEDFRDYVEKAETKAIGRALAALGFGTQFAPEIGGEAAAGRVVDSPVAPRSAPSQGQQPQPTQSPQGSPQDRQGSPPAPNPSNPASPRQQKFVLDLIKNVGENPAEFADAVAQMNAQTASEWIAKLQRQELPWLPDPKS